MYEFGEEVIIGSYKVPWLIWIQLLVMILLLLLLFFGFSILDLPNNSNSVASSSTTIGSSHANQPSNSITTLQFIPTFEVVKKEMRVEGRAERDWEGEKQDGYTIKSIGTKTDILKGKVKLAQAVKSQGRMNLKKEKDLLKRTQPFSSFLYVHNTLAITLD